MLYMLYVIYVMYGICVHICICYMYVYYVICICYICLYMLYLHMYICTCTCIQVICICKYEQGRAESKKKHSSWERRTSMSRSPWGLACQTCKYPETRNRNFQKSYEFLRFSILFLCVPRCLYVHLYFSMVFYICLCFPICFYAFLYLSICCSMILQCMFYDFLWLSTTSYGINYFWKLVARNRKGQTNNGKPMQLCENL